MKPQINIVTFFLISITVILGGLSFFIALKLKEDKAPTVPTQTKAAPAHVTYRKLLALNQAVPSISPTESMESPTQTVTPTYITPTVASLDLSPTFSPDFTPTPSQIQLVTTPLVTQEPTNPELAYTSPTITQYEVSATEEVSPTQTKTIKTLPQSGIYAVPLFIFITSVVLIFFSFII
jgi:hypothetical protein